MTAKRFTVEEMQNWNKRYKLDKETAKCVIDTFDGGEYWTVHGNEAYNLCIDMNALYDENEQLKQAYSQLKHRHSLLHDECIDAECDREGYRKDIASLEKENEQLKSSNKDAWNLIQFIYNEIKEDGSMDFGRIKDLVEFE